MTDRECYYMIETQDEYNPVSGSLEECEKALTYGVKNDPDSDEFWMDPAKDGETFAFERVVFRYVSVPLIGGKYQLPSEWPGKVHAVAYGVGVGWSLESITDDLDEIAKILAKNGNEEIEYVVCVIDQSEVTLAFKQGRLIKLEADA